MRVSLVNMPFGPLDMPALGLSVLQRELKLAGHSVGVHNLNLLYARQIGLKLYDELNTGQYDAIGEQPFADLLFPSRLNDQAFRQYISRSVSASRYAQMSGKAQRFIALCAQLIIASKPDVVGFTLVFYQRAASLALAKEIKSQNPDMRVVFGGAGCESPMGEFMMERFGFVDAVFHGDADESFIGYIDRASEGDGDYSGLRGFTYRSEGEVIKLPRARRVPMDRVPAPEFGDYLADLRLFGLCGDIAWSAPFEISRGCWWGEKHHCTFCGLNGADMTYRVKNSRQVREQIDEVVEEYAPTRIAFADNIADPSLIKKFLPSLQQHSDVKFFFEVKANLRRSDLQELATLGSVAIQPGIERLNSQVLLLMRKGVTAWQCIRLLRWCAELEIEVYWNYLLGFPGEDGQLFERELHLIKAVRHLTPPSFCAPVRLDRFSPMFQNPEGFGVRVREPIEAERWLFNNDAKAALGSYSFDYEYVRPEDNASGRWSDLEAAVSDWKTGFRSGTLLAKECGGAVQVLDRRSSTSVYEAELTASAAATFRLLRDGMSVATLSSRHPELVSTAHELVELGYVVHVDGMYLALPVWVSHARDGLMEF